MCCHCLLKLEAHLFCTSNIQRGKHCLRDFVNYTIKIVLCLVVCRAALGEKILHRTSTALSLARGLFQSDRLFPSAINKKQKTKTTKKNLPWIPKQKQDLARAMGIMRRTRDIDQYPQAQPDGTEQERRKMQIRMRRPEVLQNMLMKLCKCQQTRRCPGIDGLRL